jgi:hypothetical protein
VIGMEQEALKLVEVLNGDRPSRNDPTQLGDN